MITKEEVIATINSMGFKTEDFGEMGHLFYYNHTKFIYMPDEDDDNFLRIAIPSIYEVTDDDREAILEVINKVNMQIKYIKLCVWDDDVWAFFEYRMSDIPELEETLELIIRVLNAGYAMFMMSINGSDDTIGKEDNEDENNN